MRRNAFVYTDNRFLNASAGCLYCLSDGLDKNKWDFINKIYMLSENVDYSTPAFAFVFNYDLKARLKDFIDNRNCSDNFYYLKLLENNLPLGCLTSVNEMDTVNVPLILSNVQFYSDEEKAKIKSYKKTPLVILGCGEYMDRQDGGEIRNGDFYCKIFNTSFNEKIIVDNLYKSCFDGTDYHNGIWTQRLKQTMPSDKFFKKTAGVLSKVFLLPKIKSETNCNVLYLKKDEKNVRIILFNNENYFGSTYITLPKNIKDVKILTKAEWYKFKFKKNCIRAELQNRKCEILEVIYE